MNRERESSILELFCQTCDQWIYYQFSFYYMSNETKNWTESRQDCLKKEADLIIINSSEEQDFVKNNTVNREFWIGVNDSDVEGRWKWVDGSNLTSGFWASKEPNGGTKENCAVTYLIEHPTLLGWLDVKCNNINGSYFTCSCKVIYS
uniref:C-type lectin domain-containing protein n=1 Tax=Cyprinus carpio TaxID=7962 RepID=A0A8C2EEC4_CYPCA